MWGRYGGPRGRETGARCKIARRRAIIRAQLENGCHDGRRSRGSENYTFLSDDRQQIGRWNSYRRGKEGHVPSVTGREDGRQNRGCVPHLAQNGSGWRVMPGRMQVNRTSSLCGRVCRSSTERPVSADDLIFDPVDSMIAEKQYRKSSTDKSWTEQADVEAKHGIICDFTGK